ncbi:3,5-dihydroxyphenylacetyl-CoA monooxygenase [Tistlia consotensis]|uniref:3,5-dihydroxyphenylacetyl-CoA monooxygenase n=1 Tax=Tistlia consotensis USBA 355 TaxID=560819 RepID=A0A1Y6CK07_9PROT|nr:enoyl-CoA hydratase/isomerase family protein [Tistlia consotensis]SMF58612.1 3,5-dihydroxyphenylacetyl-CoA monooxygenase [Tistlia consotensis USBA 355]SNR63398.1 3,5-dihydroxyphenylacetyl-CoA monooxygenase [Tistlia consotensis]
MSGSESQNTTPAAVAAWTAGAPAPAGDYRADAAGFSGFWLEGLALLDGLPAKRDRSAEQQRLAESLLETARAARRRFLAAHGAALYRSLTDGLTRHRRVEALAEAAAEAVPGLAPTRARIEAEDRFPQKHKDGHEIDQGLLFNAFLADPDCGLHLCHAMLLPRAEALALAPRLEREERIDLGTAVYERKGAVSTVYMKNPRFLNAEDESTVHQVETAVDLALLDPRTSICVLRGATIEGGKYDGRNVFCTGINLTRLYYGQIPYLWYLVREMGFINKIYRGLAHEAVSPDEETGDTLEKPWVSLVEKFAIGGGCQYLLVTDYIIGAEDGYMTLPARKEGIIPGAANLRLQRFVGDRLARRLVMYDQRLDFDSPDGRRVCDEVVPAGQLEATLDEVTTRLTTSGVVSAAANRRAFRIADEPLGKFRAFMAVYAREQAFCHFSPALISNLERFWNAQNRAA